MSSFEDRTALVPGARGVNGYGTGGGAELPFGKCGKSGFGRGRGLEGLDSYLASKNMLIRLA